MNPSNMLQDKFKVGDTVKVINSYFDSQNNHIGIIKQTEWGDDRKLAVQFSEPIRFGWDVYGLCSKKPILYQILPVLPFIFVVVLVILSHFSKGQSAIMAITGMGLILFLALTAAYLHDRGYRGNGLVLHWYEIEKINAVEPIKLKRRLSLKRLSMPRIIKVLFWVIILKFLWDIMPIVEKIITKNFL